MIDLYGKQTKISKPIFYGCLALSAILVIFLQARWMGQQSGSRRDIALGAFSGVIDSQTMRIYCDNCAGSGLVRNPDRLEDLAICPVCFGVGTHFVRQINRQEALCPNCRGLGRMAGGEFDHADLCKECAGRGVVMVTNKRMKISVQQANCTHCDRRGVLRDEEDNNRLKVCPVCYGLGRRLVRHMDSHDAFCPSCLGMGRVVDEGQPAGRWCRRCYGRGLIVQTEHEAASVAP